MKRLLTDAFERMRERGDYLSALIPAEEWLFDFYRQTGYAEAAYCRLRVCMAEKKAGACRVCRVTGLQEKETASRLYGYFDKKMKERACTIRHTAAGFRNILTDSTLSGGDVFLALQPDEQIAGIAFVYPFPEEKQLIKECVADNRSIKEMLLSSVAAYYPGRTVKYREFVSSEGIPYGMVRVIDAQAMLALYASRHPACTLSIELTDDLLPGNTGVYRIENGACRKSGRAVAGMLRLGMPELVRFLFSGCRLYITLMLD